jgi:tripartite-type tricarboxylate transporter receptor subunit TctC
MAKPRSSLAIAAALGVALALFLAVPRVQAQSYPSRPLTMIVPFPAGGATDTLGRILGERMRAALGQPVVIENVAGAAGSIGVGRAVRAPADGYTLSIGTTTTHVLTGGLYALPFDLLADLAPIVLIGSEPLMVVGRKSLPAADLKELIAWLAANPDKASVGVAGVGAVGHLTGLALQKQTGTRFQTVPYRGNGPALQDLVAGQIDLMIEPSSNFLSQLRAGALTPYAVTASARLASAPDVATVDEAGLPGFHASLWYGLWVPKAVPETVISRLNAVMVESLADPAVRKRFGELGIQMAPREQQSPQFLRTFQQGEAERWWPIIKSANLRGE